MFLFFVFQTHNSTQQFYGDTTLFEYFEQLCLTNKVNLVFVEHIGDLNKFSSLNSTTKIFLNKIKCKHTFLSSFNVSQLCKRFYHSRTLQLVFPNFDNLNSSTSNLLEKATIFYSKCLQCLPPIFETSNVTFQQMFDYLKIKFSPFSTSAFRGVFVTKNTTIHLRPVLNGCDQLNDLFVPKNKLDFDLLKVPKNRCNFHLKKLNISVVLVCSKIKFKIFKIIFVNLGINVLQFKRRRSN